MAEDSPADVTQLTVQLLSAYLSNNTVESGDLAGLIATTRAALAAPADAAPAAVEETFEPAVSIRKSLASREHIISLIDGKPYKMLKRHLLGHGLTPAEYRARYNLPADYPTVAPAYSDQRREVAKTLGLGRKPAAGTAEPSVTAEAQAAPDAPVVKAKAAPKSKAAPKTKTRAKTSANAAPELEPATLVEAVIAAETEIPLPSAAKAKGVRKPKPGAKETSAPIASKDATTAPKPKKVSKAKSAPKAVAAEAPAVDAVAEPSLTQGATPAPAAKRARRSKTETPAAVQEAPPATDADKPAKKRTPKAKFEDAPSAEVAAKPVRAKRMARAPRASDEVPADVAPEPVTTDL